MTQALRDPDTALITRLAALERAVAVLQRHPSGKTSLGIGPLAPPTKAGMPLDGDYQTPPAVGTVLWDTIAMAIWVRQSAGVWKGPPGGCLDYAQVTANQTGITAETDATGLSVTVTVGTGRLVRVSAQAQLQRTVADGQHFLAIKEGATFLTYLLDCPSTTTPNTRGCSTVITPTAGSHTYKVTLNRNTGTGTLALNADASNPAWLLVEDIGPA